MLGKNALCVTCHSVMGREFKAPDPTQVTHGPDLDTRVPSRLRPDWLEVWLNTPRWIVPYTGMPAPHTKPQKGYFGDDPEQQTTALRDALINYNRLIQKDGVIKAPPPRSRDPRGRPGGNKITLRRLLIMNKKISFGMPVGRLGRPRPDRLRRRRERRHQRGPQTQ